MWRPDGWGWRAKIGLIAPHADLVPDAEISAMAPPGVSVHATRVFFGAMARDRNMNEPIELAPLRAYVEPPLLDDAAALIAGGRPSVIGYAFTSTSYLGGDADDEVLVERLERRTQGVRVITTCGALLLALRSLGLGRIALIHPPWIAGELNDLGAAYFERRGVEVLLATAAGLPGGQGDVHPGGVYEWTRSHVPIGAEAVVFGGNGFRVVGVIEALERDLGRPVLSANQALLWAALGVAGVAADSVRGYGRIFNSRMPVGD